MLLTMERIGGLFSKASGKPFYFCAAAYSIIDPDKVKDSKTAENFQTREKESGWERLRLMYSMDEFNNISPELTTVLNTGYMGLFVGALYGGIMSSKAAYLNFMERNDATAFQNHYEAKRNLQDKMTLGFGKGAFRWGWRVGLFSTMYVLLATTVSVYRGRSSWSEYVIAGGATGALYKFNLGLRGMMVGGGLGTVLGGIAGLTSYSLLKATGTSMEEVRYWQYQWRGDRKKVMAVGEREDADLFFLHEQLSKSTESPHTPESPPPTSPVK